MILHPATTWRLWLGEEKAEPDEPLSVFPHELHHACHFKSVIKREIAHGRTRSSITRFSQTTHLKPEVCTRRYVLSTRGISPTALSSGPALQRLLADITAGRVDAVVAALAARDVCYQRSVREFARLFAGGGNGFEISVPVRQAKLTRSS